jgi:Holliday junction resolvase RusA-like endonuclease
MIDAVQERIRTNRATERLLFQCCIDVKSHAIKKNSRSIHANPRTGRRWIGKSAGLRNAETYLTMAIRQKALRDGPPQPITTPVWVIFHFYFHDFYVQAKRSGEPKRMSLTLGDLSNLYQLPEDCLVRAGVIKNDALIVSHDLSRKLPSKKGHDYLELFVIDYADGYDRGD